MDTTLGPASRIAVSILFLSRTGTVKLTPRQIGEVSLEILTSRQFRPLFSRQGQSMFLCVCLGNSARSFI
jgi:hypothetical protein